MSKRKCPYLNYEWCWGEDGEEFEEKICPIESHYKGGLIDCFYSKDYKDCVTYNLQDRIDKATEYIYENAYDEDKKYAIDDIGGTDLDTLLKILKGDGNNETNNNN